MEGMETMKENPLPFILTTTTITKEVKIWLGVMSNTI
jgi:hypothetical protein